MKFANILKTNPSQIWQIWVNCNETSHLTIRLEKIAKKQLILMTNN
jgi:hypothetical protein